MKVLVIGANGKVARDAVVYLQEEGHEPLAMIRNTDQIPYFEEHGIKTVIADLEKDFSHAYQGVDAVIFAAGSGPNTGLDKTITVDQEGAIRAVEYAKQYGVKHFVMLSAMRAEDPLAGPEKLQPYLYAKRRADEYLKATDIAYTIVRPGPLTNDAGTGQVQIEKQIETPDHNSIPREDVAKALAKTVGQENVYGVSYDLLSGSVKIEDALSKL
ncbi:SDR family oxidoreductase [Bacillus tianshenii]|nr:SDR family oxidoreductase [Bacillus tianshenii]